MKRDDDYLAAWSDGKTAGLSMMSTAARIEAFAAIRRAAELARESERRCLQSLCKGHGCLHDDDAYIVRRTIRAAIGSEKHS